MMVQQGAAASTIAGERARGVLFRPQSLRRYRVAVVFQRPHPYFCKFFQSLAANPEIALTAYFYSDLGVGPTFDSGYNQKVQWDADLLSGYESRFPRNYAPRPALDRFFGLFHPGLVRELGRGYDAIILHGWWGLSSALVMLSARWRGIPLFIHSDKSAIEPIGVPHGSLRDYVLPALFRLPAGFLTVGRCNAEFYRKMGVPKEKMFPVPLAVDNEFFQAERQRLEPQRDRIRRTLGIPPDAVVFLYVGRFHPRKGLLDLLQAFAGVQNQAAHLVLAGDGPQRAALEPFVREHGLMRVHFIGLQNYSEVPASYAASDAFVLPSRHEPWGAVVNEAMNFGLPIITSRVVGAAADLVEDGVNGLLFGAGNVSQLADRLRLLAGNSELRKKMGEESSRRIAAWDFHRGAQGVLAALRAAAPSKASPRLRHPPGEPPVNPRRVAILVPALNMGGGPRVALTIATGLADLGYQTDLVALEPGGALEAECPSSVRIVHPPASGALSACSRLLGKAAGVSYAGQVYGRVPSLLRYLRAERPAVLVAFGASPAAVLAAKLAHSGCRVVVTAHVCLGHGTRRQGPLRREIQTRVTRWYASRVDSIIAVSHGVAHDLQRLTRIGSERVEVIPNPAVRPGYLKRADEPVDHPWFGAGAPPVVLAVGRLVPQKDFKTLIRAFALVAAAREARLVILGEGSEREKLEALARQLGLDGRVRMPGYQPNPLKFMSRSAVLALSSVYEGLPLVLAEALAVGTPVVATDCPSGPAEILDHGKFGRLVPARNPQALAQAILGTLDAEPDREALRARGMEFSLERVLLRYVAAIGLPPPGPSPGQTGADRPG